MFYIIIFTADFIARSKKKKEDARNQLCFGGKKKKEENKPNFITRNKKYEEDWYYSQLRKKIYIYIFRALTCGLLEGRETHPGVPFFCCLYILTLKKKKKEQRERRQTCLLNYSQSVTVSSTAPRLLHFY